MSLWKNTVTQNLERRSRIQRSDQVIFTRNLKTTLSKQKKDARNSKSGAERDIGKRRLGNARTEGSAVENFMRSQSECTCRGIREALQKKEARPQGGAIGPGTSGRREGVPPRHGKSLLAARAG